jgi:hypothetical protein
MIKRKEGNLLSRLKVKVTAVGEDYTGPSRAKLGALLVYDNCVCFQHVPHSTAA